MNKRPIIKIPITLGDKFLEVSAWALIIFTWGSILLKYGDISDTIPIHYNAKGEADSFGSKATLLLLPIISTLLFVGLTFLNKYPHVFNYLSQITAQNAAYQYQMATRLVRYIKLIIVLVFSFITLHVIQYANGEPKGLGNWFLPLCLGLIFVPLFYFIAKSKKKPNT